MNLPTHLFSFLWYFAKRQWIAFVIILVTAMMWATNEIFYPFFIKLIVNTINTHQGDRSTIYFALVYPLGGLVLFWLVTELGLRLQGFVQLKTFPQFRANIREAVFNYVKQHSHEYFSDHFTGAIAKKLSELPSSCQTLIEIIIFQFTAVLVGLTIALIMMGLTKPLFALVLFVWFCSHMGLTLWFVSRANRLWELHSESISVLSGKMVDSFTNILNVRLFVRGDYESEYLQKFQKDEMSKAKSALWLIEIMRICQGLCGLALIFTMLFVLIHGWVKGQVTIGDFPLVTMQTFWVLGMVWFMSYQVTIFVRELGTVSEALTLVKKPHDIIDVPQAKSLMVKRGEIQFDQVQFAYRSLHPVFEGLNVTIESGKKIGLVGFSGSGKSTFVNLILRFYDLQSGRILIDGQDIAQVTQASLRAQIAMIPQEPTLFHRSLRENIAYGRLDASEAEIMEASKLAHCHEFIECLPEGYNALVGERGIKLSGGQRQRIAIARAMLKNAPILILDEATSSLDSVTERLIQDSLHHLMKDKTTLVIAHRLSTLANMDKIIVFHQGKIVEAGTKDSLLKANGHFAQLWAMQTDGFLPNESKVVL